MHACKEGGFRVGKPNAGSVKKLVATFNDENSCNRAVQSLCPSSNGATFSPGLGECWCDTEMQGLLHDPTLRTCEFEGASPISRFTLGGLAQQGVASCLVACGLFAAAALASAIASVAVLRRWRSHLEDAMDHSQLMPVDGNTAEE